MAPRPVALPMEVDAANQTATFNIPYPSRGFFGFAVFFAVLGAFLTVVSFALTVDGAKDRDALPFLWTLSLGLLAGGVLACLYLKTRWRRTILSPGKVVIENGWLLHRDSRRLPLSQFRGVRGRIHRRAAMTGADAAANAVGVALTTVLAVCTGFVGLGVHHSIVTAYLIELCPYSGNNETVLLACHPDAAFIQHLIPEVAELFSLPILRPEGTGPAIRRARSIAVPELWPAPEAGTAFDTAVALGPSPETDTAALLEELGATVRAELPLPAPPPGLTVHEEADKMVVQGPKSRGLFYVGLLLGIPLFALGLAVWIYIGTMTGTFSGGPALVGFVPLVLGAMAIFAGHCAGQRRAAVTIWQDGVIIESASRGIPAQQLALAELDNVTMSLTRGKPGLRFATVRGDFWFGSGLKVAQLEWLRKAILRRAALVRGDQQAGSPGAKG